jgi:GrpB-like predicted nucleotidyltransferase (UPF0157 family)
MAVIIQPHNPIWIEEFNRAKKDLQIILSNVSIISIEHVGSTSVPDLVAKPVIDIAIIVKTEEDASLASDALVTAGYTALGELGIVGRWVFRQPGHKAGDQATGSWIEGEEIRRNTYVSLDGGISLRNHLDLKKTLLADEKLRHEYGAVKSRLVDSGVNNVDEYCARKTEVILKILERAGWGESDLDVLRQANL